MINHAVIRYPMNEKIIMPNRAAMIASLLPELIPDSFCQTAISEFRSIVPILAF
jgi:hypothetical protein